ncbi:MAG: A24 family peptidase [Steroidobacteraceae bacterium]
MFSLLVGSFLNVVIHRLPVMLDRRWRADAAEILGAAAAEPPAGGVSPPADDAAEATEPAAVIEPSATPPERYDLVHPRSACPHCGAPIRAHQNIPVVSWLALGGRCATCRAPISVRYPLVEIGTAVLSAAVVWRYGWEWQAVAALLVTWSLISLAMIDLDHQLLPDAITLPLMWGGLLASVAWTPGPALSIPVDPWSAITGAAAGYLVLWSVYWAFKLVTGKEGMGYGDFKLLAALGAWMGWQALPLVLLLSALTGAVIGLSMIVLRGRGRDVPIPFGPYLAAAGWIALMWGPDLLGSALHVAGLDT